MEQKTENKEDKNFLKVIAIFLAFFAGLIFVAAGLSESSSAAITNFICGSVLAIVASIFYLGYKRSME